MLNYINLIFVGKMAYLGDVEVACSNAKLAAYKVKPRTA